ncbi:TlpA family protein disulfide reductase [Leeia sp. TBRC 13508]|uniref:TlpA family protein disulfide reductase n=1 Tax=Leeia speluncae TaxID=2884804 RepID=A0ABS8D476_9NEIS|nr:TlpA disulfide reductase family protein [Leeia speluncae]MCB6183009.1 TlpA family protein disulfide reductase [Leeia speluncae]
MKSLKRLVLASAALILMAGCSNQPTAPDVNYTTLTNQTQSFKNLQGKVVLVDFWATSCTGCVEEMAEMTKTYQQFNPRGYEMVAVAMSYDPPEYVRNFVATRKLPFSVTMDSDGSLQKAFGEKFTEIVAVPTTFLIGKDGKLIKTYVGSPNFTELRQEIEKALQS